MARWEQPNITEILRGTVSLWNWRVGQLALVTAGVPLSYRNTRAREVSTYPVDRHGNFREHNYKSKASTSSASTDDGGTGEPIVVQIARGESPTAILQGVLINIVRALTVFFMLMILLVGGVYSWVLKITHNAQLTPQQNAYLAVALVVTYAGGLFTTWLMQQVHVETDVQI
jgi:hypothetical protein